MIAERADAFTARFYHHLFLIDAGAAQLFNGVDMSNHARGLDGRSAGANSSSQSRR